MRISKRFGALVLSSGLALASAAAEPARPCTKHSPAHTVALLELYTSEGCNSCPPADSFVRSLYHSRFTPDQVVPLSLHVDYWDSLGWRDRFATAEFTQRQYWLSSTAHGRSVYTPEVFLAGREERDWRDRDFENAVAAINARVARASIELIERPAPEGSISVSATARVAAAEKGAPLGLYFAVYENDLVSEVKAGENSGATLRHGFVVRQWSPPVPLDAEGGAVLNWDKRLPADAHSASLGFVAFVENTRTGEVLQTVALPACGLR